MTPFPDEAHKNVYSELLYPCAHTKVGQSTKEMIPSSTCDTAYSEAAEYWPHRIEIVIKRINNATNFSPNVSAKFIRNKRTKGS